MYRSIITALARNETIKRFLINFPLTRRAMNQFVISDSWPEVKQAVITLIESGRRVTIDYLSQAAHSEVEAATTTATYLAILDEIRQEGWADLVDVTVKLTALGLLVRQGEPLASENARQIAAKAKEVGTNITIDLEDATTIMRTQRIVRALRQEFPDVGCVVRANLKRTEADCRAFADTRVRLRKGAYRVPTRAAHSDRHDVNLSYVRCLKILMEGKGRPVIATHDPIMIEIAQELAAHSSRGLKDFEFQMRYGVRPLEQARLADLEHIVRVKIPYGPDWYGYIVRRLGERPRNLIYFFRAIGRRG
ncbi:MAG: proline dehydrogenase family protein [Propionibacteriaceae bacterium]|jgi:proline dehydrogenase|nr:proline dehydrogenase family protein [Propionibacteriaceae bacterium]